MQYISPFHHLPEDILTTILTSPTQLKLIRKRLLAEIELSTTQTISINGRELTKFDIITLFDNLKESDLLEIHLAIFQNKALLNFLENGENPKSFYFAENPLLTSEKALHFISPYYKQAAANLLVMAFQKKELHTFKAFFRGKHLLLEEDNFFIYEQLSRKIKGFCNQLEATKSKMQMPNYIFRKGDLNALQFSANILILNELPEEYAQLREEIAYATNSLGCVLINTSKNKEAITLFEIGLLLICSEHIRGFFSRNLATAKQNNEILTSRKWFHSSDGNANTNWIIFIIIFAVIRIFVSLSNSSTNNSISTLENYQQYQRDNKQIFENLEKLTLPKIGRVDSLESRFKRTLLLTRSNFAFEGKNAERVSLPKGKEVFEDFLPTHIRDKDSAKKWRGKRFTFSNKTSYDCILLMQGKKYREQKKPEVMSYHSFYVPAHQSFEVKLQYDEYDIYPCLGKNLMKRELTVFNNEYIQNITLPPYFFETTSAHPVQGIQNLKTAEIDANSALYLLKPLENEYFEWEVKGFGTNYPNEK